MLKTKKQKAVALGALAVCLCIYDIFTTLTWEVIVLKSIRYTLLGAILAYWLYHRKEPEKDENGNIVHEFQWWAPLRFGRRFNLRFTERQPKSENVEEKSE